MKLAPLCVGAVSAFGFTLTACSGPADPGTAEMSLVDSFCEAVNQFVPPTPTGQGAGVRPEAELFAQLEHEFGVLAEVAPPEIKPDIEKMQATYGAMNKAASGAEYDPDNGMDFDVLRQSSIAVQQYVDAECDPNVDVVDPPPVDDIMKAFSVERELARCIYQEMGDVANIDPAELTPDLLTSQVCGTSLFALLSGTGPTTG